MKNTVFSAWNLMRVLRLALGIFILGDGIAQGEAMFIGAGVLFTLMPLLNIGCCSTSGCATNFGPSNQNTSEISYEEVHKK